MRNSHIIQLCRKGFVRLERLMQADLRYLVRGGSWLTFGQGIMGLSSFGLAILFARFVTPEAYGTYKYLMSIVGILTISTLPSIPTAITQRVAQGIPFNMRLVVRERIRWSLLGSAAALALACWHFFIQHEPGTAYALLIIAIIFPYWRSFDVYDGVLLGRSDFRTSSRYAMLGQIATVLGVALCIWLRASILIIVTVGIAIPLLQRIYFYRRLSPQFSYAPGDEAGVISYGKHLTAMSILTTIASYFDKLIAFQFLGPQTLALYSIAIAPVEQIKSLVGNLDTLILTKFAHGDERTIRKTIWKRYLTLFVFTACIIGGYILVAPFFFRFAFPTYPQAAHYSQLFVLSIANIIFFPASTLMRAKGKLREQYIGSIVMPIFQIVTMTLFSWMWGLTGLLIARIASRWTATGLNVYLLHRSPIEPEPIKPASEGAAGS